MKYAITIFLILIAVILLNRFNKQDVAQDGLPSGLAIHTETKINVH